MMSGYEALIKSALPTLACNKVTEIVAHLTVLGVESQQDLCLVKEEHLAHFLPPIQARKLIKSWIEDESEPKASGSEYAESEMSSSVLEENIDLSSSLEWSERFSVPWNKLPAKLMEACISGRRPSPPLRKEMVRIIVEDMLSFSPKPSKLDIKRISKKIVNKYPQAFMDKIDQDGPKLGERYHSLVDQISNRIEYVMRRRWLFGQTSQSTPLKNDESSTRSGLHPDDVGEKMIWLQDEFKKTNREKKKVQKLMNDLYENQRLDIDNNMPLATLRVSWPFITEKDILFNHFYRLTNKPHFIDNLLKKAGLVVRTLGACKHKGMQDVIIQIKNACSEQKSEAPIFRGILDVLCCYFKERVSEIYRLIQTDSSLEDCVKECGPTPVLIITGVSVYEFKEIAVLVENLVAFRSQSFEQCLAYLFFSFYVFNMKYPEAALATYEFLQRYFGEIEGPLSKSLKRRKIDFHPKVLTALRLIASKF